MKVRHVENKAISQDFQEGNHSRLIKQKPLQLCTYLCVDLLRHSPEGLRGNPPYCTVLARVI